MKIYLSPQVNDSKIFYEFDEDVVRVRIGSVSEEFDFSGVPDGELSLRGKDGELLIETSLEPFPLESAEKRGGILYLELLNWIGVNASYEERFPEWIDAKDYVAPEIAKEELEEVPEGSDGPSTKKDTAQEEDTKETPKKHEAPSTGEKGATEKNELLTTEEKATDDWGDF